MVHDCPKKWFSWLPLAKFWYNTSYHTSLICSPFKALYGTEPNYGMIPDMSLVSNADASDIFKEREQYSEMLKTQLQRAQLCMKQFADQHRSFREFRVGDQVYLKLQPYAQSLVVNRPFPKLAFKFFGPFEILARVGPTAYKVQLAAGSLMHPVFHISQLKQHVPDHTPVFSTLPHIPDLSVADTVPEAILDKRLVVKKGNAAHLQVFVRWSSLQATSSTWENYTVIKERYPHAPAWGQAGPEGGGNVVAALEAMGMMPPLKKSRHASTMEKA